MPFAAAPLLLALTAPAPGPEERALAPALGVSVFATSVWLGLVAGQEQHAPATCRICTPPAADEAVRAAIVWKKTALATKLSDAGLGLTSAWALGSLTLAAVADQRLRAADSLLVVESTALAMMLNQIVKLETARKRPDAPGEKSKPHPQHNMSFFSGHATWSFASSVSAGTVAMLRGYRGAPVVLGGGLALATATSYFRLAANRHWPTDVLAGAAVGALIGALVPRLHLVSPDPARTSTSSMGLGAAPTWITVGGVLSSPGRTRMVHLSRARLCGFATALAVAAVLGACRGRSEHEAARTAAPAAGAASRQIRIARGLASASPPADPADPKARDAAGEALAHFGDLIDAAGERVLWGGFEPENGYDPKGQALTELSPVVWAKLYLSTFTFTGAYELREDGQRTIVEVDARFRDGLDAGDYPYPFWHSARKWRSYVDTRSLILVFERDRLVAAYRRAAVREEGPGGARRWDGRWRWTDARGVEQPRVALYSYLLSADNPSVASLDRAYRSLEEAFRRHHCDGCHAPDNAAGQSPLFLLDFPNQALAARHALVETLRRDTMPPADPRAGGRAGLPDEAERRQLLALAEQFEREADRALAFEQARARGGAPAR